MTTLLEFLNKHRVYAGYVVHHKWCVWLECLESGLIWQGLIHDWHKFLPDEWIAYANYFAPGRKVRDQYGNLLPDSEFDRAWNRHQKRAPHHWQYWLLTRDSGETVELQMPERYWREMLADWRGIARQKGTNTLEWYLKNRSNIQLHFITRAELERELGLHTRANTGWPFALYVEEG